MSDKPPLILPDGSQVDLTRDLKRDIINREYADSERLFAGSLNIITDLIEDENLLAFLDPSKPCYHPIFEFIRPAFSRKNFLGNIDELEAEIRCLKLQTIIIQLKQYVEDEPDAEKLKVQLDELYNTFEVSITGSINGFNMRHMTQKHINLVSNDSAFGQSDQKKKKAGLLGRLFG